MSYKVSNSGNRIQAKTVSFYKTFTIHTRWSFYKGLVKASTLFQGYGLAVSALGAINGATNRVSFSTPESVINVDSRSLYQLFTDLGCKT